ncbi:sigma-70 family RNA polymerase sigma factor [Embleya sp. NBC_00896]|uniref:sigma-70 family RNA polymerase sigma factor n=1 Tax=Embleya sp. NBC_00896 TaxID=2975961 RepID=UPI002F90B01E|nr:hypothetical protein OG928_47685 [Embleya sp. NBC_00896]
MTHPDPPAAALPHDFTAFHEANDRLWRAYTHLLTGDADTASETVDAAFVEVALTWTRLEHPTAAAAWAILRRHLAQRLRERDHVSALAEMRAFDSAAFTEDGPDRDHFHTLENRIALCAAITRLPPDEHDVIVLTCVLRRTDDVAARALGMGVDVVRTHAEKALARLDRDLCPDEAAHPVPTRTKNRRDRRGRVTRAPRA